MRAELYEFLAIVAKRSFEADKANIDLAELEKIVGVALLPDINRNAETVLHYMHPIDEDRGFTAEINLGEVADEHKRTVRSTLNAGATLGRVQRAGKTAGYFYIHRDLYKTLARIRARTLMAEYGRPRIASGQQQGERFGGSITERAKAIEHKPARPPVDENYRPKSAVASSPQLLAALNFELTLGSAFPATRTLPPSPPTRLSAAPARAQRRRSMRCCASAKTRHACRSMRGTPLLKSKLRPQASWDLQLLDDAYQELDQHWPVLMLLPNGPYESVLRDLVEGLEADAAPAGCRTNSQRSTNSRARCPTPSRPTRRTTKPHGAGSRRL